MAWREALEAYLSGRLAAAERVRIARAGPMPAGASNQTVAIDLAVSCDGRDMMVPLVLRPQRAGGPLAPYDVRRQFTVMRALQQTAVPVPAVAWFEDDPAVPGAPFYLMARVQAETLPLFWYGGGSPRLPAAAAALAAIHAVDWRAAGLDVLLPPGGPGSPLECELAAWRQRAALRRVDREPLVQRLEAWLLANEPADARHALVHGDPNPGNYLFRGDDVVAVVDWELAAIGDPRSDLGFYAALSTVFGPWPSGGGRTVLSDAYERVTGGVLSDLPYYEAWGLYRMLVVLAGWGGLGFGYGGLDAVEHRLRVLLGPRWAG
jgi:aminoglycoside phosphotransferase (APT) family kinase protein